MRPIVILLFLCSFVFLQSCSGNTTNNTSTPANVTSAAASSTPTLANAGTTPGPVSSPAAVKAKIDACSLLTSAEIQAVQGEQLKETKPTDRQSAGFITSLCYYELATPSNSISLSVTQSDGAKPGAIKEYWESTFGKDENKSDKDREKKRASQAESGERKGEDEEGAPLNSVRGIGDEAFWSASRVGGALYVLKGDRYIRISVGGKGDNEAKLKKSKTLALKALRRV